MGRSGISVSGIEAGAGMECWNWDVVWWFNWWRTSSGKIWFPVNSAMVEAALVGTLQRSYEDSARLGKGSGQLELEVFGVPCSVVGLRDRIDNFSPD